MQIVNVYNSNLETAATNLKNALAQYASAYFDSYDTDFTDANGVKRILCKIGQTTVVEFQYKTSTAYFKMVVGGKTFSIDSSSYWFEIKSLYVYENAILFALVNQHGSDYYNMPLLLCKKKNGDTALVFFSNEAITQIAAASTGTLRSCVVSISRSTGAADFSVLPLVFSGNNANSVSGFTLFSFNDGNAVKDVFVVINSDFRSHTAPFAYTLDDVTYAGIAGNYLAVKGT